MNRHRPMNRYPPPLDRLLQLGEAPARAAEWPDYLGLGLRPEHVPSLLAMIADPQLLESDSPESYAPIHAWRSLGQLRAANAVEPLTALFDELADWDWVGEELPRVFGLIGAPSIPTLVRVLDRRTHGLEPRISAAEALAHVARSHPDTRSACVAALATQLGHFATQDRVLNAFLIADLIELDAVEEAPLMERAFTARRVALGIAGDWEDVRIGLGLLSERLTPRPDYLADSGMSSGGAPPLPSPPRQARPDARKRRRKLAKASKRKNRRRK